jgi:hypothetical protein
MTISRWILRRIKNIWDENRIENQNTHFMSNNFFFPRKSCRLWNMIWWSQRDHKWRQNMAHTSCMLDKQAYMHSRACIRPRSQAHARARTHTHKYVILFFSAATMVTWTRLNITLYVHCLSCYLLLKPFIFVTSRHVLFISMCTVSRVNNPRWEV